MEAEKYENNTSSPLLCMNCNEHCFHCDQKHSNKNSDNVLLYVKYKRTWCYALQKSTTNLSCKEKKSNGKLYLLCKFSTNTGKYVTKVHGIPGTNCIRYTQKNLPSAQNISDEGTGAKNSQSSLQSPSPLTKQKENNKPPCTPKNTSKYTYESPISPTFQTKSDKPSHPKKMIANNFKSLNNSKYPPTMHN